MRPSARHYQMYFYPGLQLDRGHSGTQGPRWVTDPRHPSHRDYNYGRLNSGLELIQRRWIPNHSSLWAVAIMRWFTVLGLVLIFNPSTFTSESTNIHSTFVNNWYGDRDVLIVLWLADAHVDGVQRFGSPQVNSSTQFLASWKDFRPKGTWEIYDLFLVSRSASPYTKTKVRILRSIERNGTVFSTWFNGQLTLCSFRTELNAVLY
ncbi:hypothetical protein C8F04DRAFT_1198179 [Mycena alexandri]|uniref:Uncharacterized protein n=1 Tax=Mycena alexandri TaxID=1745969 RepID=A0AAD6S1B2_9AGAR|nr:hypothetical protein C8F04DRAFT_1198179 [Mycena alexandri]